MTGFGMLVGSLVMGDIDETKVNALYNEVQG